MKTVISLSLLVIVMGQRQRREVVRTDDGLFYHQGPYFSHGQVNRQALGLPLNKDPFSPYPLLLPQPHHSTPVRFPQPDIPSFGPRLPLQSSQQFEQMTPKEGQRFIGPALPNQHPQHPILSPVFPLQTPAPAITFLDHKSRTQPQHINSPQHSSHSPSAVSPLAAEQTRPGSALEKLMAIAGDNWDLSPGPASEVFVCPVSEGHFPSPSDCSVYYQCAQGRPHRRECGPGLAYNAITNQCDWADTVPC